MVGIQLDLSNSANWEPLYSFEKNVVSVSPRTYLPIPEIEIPIQTDKSILAAFAESNKAPNRWKSAGWLAQRFALGITVGGQQDADASNSRRVLLNRISLIQFPAYTTTFALSFFAHSWLEHIKVNLWQYTGPIADSVIEEIQLTRVDVLRTEAKVNFLIQGLNQ